MTNSEFIKHIDGLRKASKGQWYQFIGHVDGRVVKVKAFGTWLQIYIVDGVQMGTTMDNSVSNFKLELSQGLK